MPSLLALSLVTLLTLTAALKDGECEVCLKALGDISTKLGAAGRSDLLKIESAIGDYCAKPPSVRFSVVTCMNF